MQEDRKKRRSSKPKRDFLAPRPRKADRKRKAPADATETVAVSIEDDAAQSSHRVSTEASDAASSAASAAGVVADAVAVPARAEKRRRTETVAPKAADDFGLGAAREQQQQQEKEGRRERTQAAQAAAEEKRKGRKPKYIVFVGNLPYSADETAIRKQFRACRNFGEIVGVRLLTKKGSNEPKGCAFVEFSEGACVAQALKLHHSDMDGRQINVEKTVGGGGNGPARRAKLQQKLDRLSRDRQRHFNSVVRAQAEQGYEYS